jgi:hypothetical protein
MFYIKNIVSHDVLKEIIPQENKQTQYGYEYQLTKKKIYTLGYKKYQIKGKYYGIKQNSKHSFFAVYDIHNIDRTGYLRTKIFGPYVKLLDLSVGNIIAVNAWINKLTVTKTYMVTPQDNQRVIQRKQSKKPKIREYFEIQMQLLQEGRSLRQQMLHLETTMKKSLYCENIVYKTSIPQGGFIYTIKR